MMYYEGEEDILSAEQINELAQQGLYPTQSREVSAYIQPLNRHRELTIACFPS